MLLHIIFLQYIGIASASQNTFGYVKDNFTPYDDQEVLTRFARQIKRKKDDFSEDAPSCDQLSSTSRSPFVVIMLFRTSGHFLGMGSIIDRKTVLTSTKAIERTLMNPPSLVIVAGRLSPWWGRYSQVIHATTIYQNDLELALVILNKELAFNKNIKPVHLDQLPVPLKMPEFKEKFNEHWAVFGIPRSSWDSPGDPTTKSSIYIMRTETACQKQEHWDACKATFPDVEFNDTVMICTYANGTYCWGCVGSPTITITKADSILQIAVLIRASYTEVDEYHIHVKIGYFEQWIKSHSFMKKL